MCQKKVPFLEQDFFDTLGLKIYQEYKQFQIIVFFILTKKILQNILHKKEHFFDTQYKIMY